MELMHFPYLTLQQRLDLKLNAFDLSQQPFVHTELPESTFAVPNKVCMHIAVGPCPLVEVIGVIAYVLPLDLGYRRVTSVAIPSSAELPKTDRPSSAIELSTEGYVEDTAASRPSHPPASCSVRR